MLIAPPTTTNTVVSAATSTSSSPLSSSSRTLPLTHISFDSSHSPTNSKHAVVASSSASSSASNSTLNSNVPTTDEVEVLRKEVRRLAQDRGKIDKELSLFSNQISTLKKQIDEKDLNISQLSASLEEARKLTLASPRSPASSDTSSFNISDISYSSSSDTAATTSVLVLRQATPAVFQHTSPPDAALQLQQQQQQQQQQLLAQMQQKHEQHEQQQQHLLEQNQRRMIELEEEIRKQNAQLDEYNRTITGLIEDKEELQRLLMEQQRQVQIQVQNSKTDSKMLQPSPQTIEAMLAELPTKLDSLRKCIETLSPQIEEGQTQLMTVIKGNLSQDHTALESYRISEKLNTLKTKLEAQKKLSNQLRQEWDFLRPIVDSSDNKPLSRVWVLIFILCYFVIAAITVYVVFLSAPTFRLPRS